MTFEHQTEMSNGMDQDTTIGREFQPGDRVFVQPHEHQNQIQITLDSRYGYTWLGRVSGHYPPLDASAEPQRYGWGSPQRVKKGQVIHHEYGG